MPDRIDPDSLVLVKCSPEIVAQLANEDSEPVVIIGMDRQDDGTYEMMLRSVTDLKARAERAEAALRKIDNLGLKWRAPLTHKPGDFGEKAWATVGSEASLIAHRALGGSLESSRARLVAGQEADRACERCGGHGVQVYGDRESPCLGCNGTGKVRADRLVSLNAVVEELREYDQHEGSGDAWADFIERNFKEDDRPERTMRLCVAAFLNALLDDDRAMLFGGTKFIAENEDQDVRDIFRAALLAAVQEAHRD